MIINKDSVGVLSVLKTSKEPQRFDEVKVRATVERCRIGLQGIDVDAVVSETAKNVYDGIPASDIEKAVMLAATSFIEREPDYSRLAARVFLQKIKKQIFGVSTENGSPEADRIYRDSFIASIQKGIDNDLTNGQMAEYDLEFLASKLHPERDDLLEYMGMTTLYERYFLKIGENRIETPQAFWMRVAMGMALKENDPEDRAVEFYEAMSQFLYVPSTPTLFNSGTTHPQLSSCFLSTVCDDLKHIVECTGDDAELAKHSGGVATDFSSLRAARAFIKSTKVESQGVIPFLKINNDWTVAINRSGKRRGAKAVYLETWHLDIEDFLDLRKNTGDERRRTPDIDTVNWIPDLFMKRYMENGDWTLFSPDEAPDLHELYGKKFETAYIAYEAKAAAGKMKLHKTLKARKLGHKMFQMLFETGHPWFTFKDVCNIRSPQDHCGTVHSSNLCTEITLNTSKEEIAVCNLGSVVVVNHMELGKVNYAKLAKTVHTAMRMLDNVIDLGYYPVEKAKKSNLRHRPVGLGVMGIQDALYLADINYENSHDFQDEIMEFITYQGISTSSDLAVERGAYETYQGSKWSRGIFPLDTIALVEQERGMKIETDRKTRLDWAALKEKVARQGMRNSNCFAIAPTATIANITGVTPGGESSFKQMFVKSNMSGEFTVINRYLVDDLKKLGLWSQNMCDQIKFHNGGIAGIPEIPEAIREKYKDCFDVDQKVGLQLCAIRGKWIDQSQSHNIFFKGNSGRELEEIYFYAWQKCGVKTTYYLRTQAISQIEKSTLDAKKFGFTQRRPEDEARRIAILAKGVADETAKSEWDAFVESQLQSGVKLCRINDPTCESCQ